MCALYGLFVLSFLFAEIDAKFEFTNIKCQSMDEKYVTFDYCFLKSINRTYKYASVKIKLLKPPVNDLTLNLALLKRYNGYKPFLYNFTVNGCTFLRSRRPSNPVATYFYEFLKPFTNINHSCPFNHDLVLDKITIDFVDYRTTKILPFPEGDYMVDTTWSTNGIQRTNIKIYGTVS